MTVRSTARSFALIALSLFSTCGLFSLIAMAFHFTLSRLGRLSGYGRQPALRHDAVLPINVPVFCIRTQRARRPSLPIRFAPLSGTNLLLGKRIAGRRRTSRVPWASAPGTNRHSRRRTRIPYAQPPKTKGHAGRKPILRPALLARFLTSPRHLRRRSDISRPNPAGPGARSRRVFRSCRTTIQARHRVADRSTILYPGPFGSSWLLFPAAVRGRSKRPPTCPG